MANQERVRDRGIRRATESLDALGRAFREARLAANLSQQAVSGATHIDRSWISRFERGHASAMRLEDCHVLLAAVGLDLATRTYVAGDPMRDDPQARLLGRLFRELPEVVGFQMEVGLPLPGDPRAWDALLRIGSERWGVEAETGIRDLQARSRSLQLKKRDGGVDGVILLLRDSHHHRRLIHEHRDLIRALCPVGPRDALAALRAGVPPAGDAYILL
jgi:transcriptional regulator with XRE-family HTH domain